MGQGGASATLPVAELHSPVAPPGMNRTMHETTVRDLSGKTALVTGGGTGIGLGIARALAAAGCRTGIGGRRDDVLQEAVANTSDAASLQTHVVDVADRASVSAFVHWGREALGPVDILVNAAGINIKTRSMAEMTPAQWDQIIAVNLTGAYNLMHAVLPDMRQRGSGFIVHINSIAGVIFNPIAGIAYTASKWGMTGLVSAVAEEEEAHGIRITSICPGEVETPLLDQRPVEVGPERRAMILQPEDLAEVVVTLARMPSRVQVPELVIRPLERR